MSHVWVPPWSMNDWGRDCACGLCVSSSVVHLGLSCLNWGGPKVKCQTWIPKGENVEGLGFRIPFPIDIGAAAVYV